MTHSAQANSVSRNSIFRIFTTSLRSARGLTVAAMAFPLVLGDAGGVSNAWICWRLPRSSQRTFWSDQQSLPSPGVTEDDSATVLPERLQRKIVSFESREAPGTIVIDTGNTTLYYVLGQGRAIRYGVGVGREGSPGLASRPYRARRHGRTGIRRRR